MKFDTDLFKITTASAGKVSIDFDAPTNSTYSDYFYVSLFDNSGKMLEEKITGKDVSFSSNVDAAGSYYVKVKSDTYYTGDEYSLTSSFEATGIDTPSVDGTRNSDVVEGTTGNDLFGYLGGNDVIYAGEGEDTLSIIGATSSEFELKQISNLSSLKSVGSSTFGDVSIRGLDFENITWAGTTIEVENTSDIFFDEDELTFGTVFSDRISGTQEQDFIDGLGGADIIDGGAGRDH